MNDFSAFSKAVKMQFDAMSAHELFYVEPEDIFASYLNAFPIGTNPIYRERTEHDCSCCKHFVRHLGHVFAIVDGQRVTIWDAPGLAEPYATVAATMAKLVKQLPLKSVFRTKEHSFGVESNLGLIDGATQRFHHFVAQIDRKHRAAEPDTARSVIESAAQVFRRGLEELKASDFDTVLDLINANAIYRGAEFKGPVTAFKRLVAEYAKKSPSDREAFVWANVNEPSARFRNTAIGTLLVDLAEGVEIERAVKSFETKVAPTNYKRTTALITPKMVEQAVAKLEELGLTGALERRFAKLSDVSVQNVLWVDNAVKGGMKGGIAALLERDVKQPTFDPKKGRPISAVDFVKGILPDVSSMQVYLENKHLANFMSLTAPVHEDTGNLFKWDNDFAWSYDGDVADSIKQRVKAAGGKVTGTLRVSLGWFNFDDLDLHVLEPDGNHISFRNKCGKLDVDMNAGGGTSREAVENVTWQGRMRDGKYSVMVHQWAKRENIDVGFTVEVEDANGARQYSYAKAAAGEVPCLELTVKNNVVESIRVAAGLKEGSTSTEKWGVRTGSLVPVDTIMHSPNFWDGQSVGNQHTFFMLNGMKNPDATRGIYNEFLRGSLDPHRKVFEVLGARTKCPPADDQLSGVGFSSTRGDQVVIVVKGAQLSGTFNVQF